MNITIKRVRFKSLPSRHGFITSSLLGSSPIRFSRIYVFRFDASLDKKTKMHSSFVEWEFSEGEKPRSKHPNLFRPICHFSDDCGMGNAVILQTQQKRIRLRACNADQEPAGGLGVK